MSKTIDKIMVGILFTSPNTWLLLYACTQPYHVRMRAVIAITRGWCRRVSTVLLGFLHAIKGMLTSDKRHKVF